MLKKIVVLAGVLGSMATLAAVGCSSSSNGATGGGSDASSSDDSGKKGKDGGGLSGDGGSNTDGGGKSDGGVVVDEDSGTITGIDAGGDGGPITLTDGGTLDAPACYDLGGASYFPDATAAVANQNKCNSTQIGTYYSACLDGTTGNTTDCNAFVTANAACATCIQGPSAAGTPFAFPVIVPVGTDSVEVSYEACYAALSTGTAACKANVPNEAMCVDNGCSTCTTDATACQDYGYADPSGCQTVAPVDTTCFNAVNTASMNATNQTKCGADASDFQGFYTAVATTLCGP